MSTAGKVLTVLILIVMIPWLIMMSAVTQLNVNYEEKIAAQQKTLDKLADDVAKATSGAQTLTEQARALQDTTDLELREILGRIAAAERRQSSTVEDLTRIKAQVADITAAAETSKKNLAIREAEKAKGEEDLAKKKDEIAKAQAKNADLRGELAQLQDEFKRLLADNAAKAADAARKSPAKPASSRRESPAS